ncbi:hypothetical protein V5E97_06830 [Singulisphaera sp. Ch08]|uniref:Uncharacterized protein n=1 Tax=Singulisphaera sp. Ch08 TaxID=3120278 RepID=A0AAU7CKW6_9BACT
MGMPILAGLIVYLIIALMIGGIFVHIERKHRGLAWPKAIGVGLTIGAFWPFLLLAAF